MNVFIGSFSIWGFKTSLRTGSYCATGPVKTEFRHKTNRFDQSKILLNRANRFKWDSKPITGTKEPRLLWVKALDREPVRLNQ